VSKKTVGLLRLGRARGGFLVKRPSQKRPGPPRRVGEKSGRIFGETTPAEKKKGRVIWYEKRRTWARLGGRKGEKKNVEKPIPTEDKERGRETRKEARPHECA